MGKNDGWRRPTKSDAAYDQHARGGAAQRPTMAQAGGGAASQSIRAAEIETKAETFKREGPPSTRRPETAAQDWRRR